MADLEGQASSQQGHNRFARQFNSVTEILVGIGFVAYGIRELNVPTVFVGLGAMAVGAFTLPTDK